MMDNQLRDVRIVRLLAMAVASYRAESDTPEQDCAGVMNKFVLDNSLHDKREFRHFGFNNPNPTANNPVYGYEMCVSIPADFTVPAPFLKKDFTGGLYASIVATMDDMGERWGQLYDWVSKSDNYDFAANSLCMEECLNFETLVSGNNIEIQFDLLQPVIMKRNGGEHDE